MDDKDYEPHESFCDTQNNISELCNCMVGGYIEEIEELKRVNEEMREMLQSGVFLILTESNKIWREKAKEFLDKMESGK